MYYITNKNEEFFTGEGFSSRINEAKFFPEEELMKFKSIFPGCQFKEYEEDPREYWVDLSVDELVDLYIKMNELGYRASIDCISGDCVPADTPLKLSVLDCSCCGILKYLCISSNKSPFKHIIDTSDTSFFLRLYGDIEISIGPDECPLFMDFIHESKLPMSQYEILKMMINK